MQVIVDVVKKDGTAIKGTDGKWYQASKFARISFSENKRGDTLEIDADAKGFVRNVKKYAESAAVAVVEKQAEPSPKRDNAPSIPVKGYVAPPLQNKDTRILYQGIIQALVQSPALPQYSSTKAEYIKLVLDTAEEIASYIVAKG